MLLLVDLDDVLADTEIAFTQRLAERHPSIPVIPESKRTTFHLEDQYPPKIVEAILNEPGYFASLPPIVDGIATLTDLLVAGVDVRICTAPLLSNPYCASEKLDWVARHLGVSWCRRVIITTDKTLIRGDFLFDDKPIISGSLTPSWQQILFSRPWNRELQTIPRLSSWSGFWPLWKELVARTTSA